MATLEAHDLREWGLGKHRSVDDYPYGGGVAEIWSKHVKGVKAVAEVTGASVENVKLAHKGETVIGEVMGDVAVAGFSGLSKFKGKKHDILSMAIMYPNLLQVVTLKKSGITRSRQQVGCRSFLPAQV